LVGCGLGALQVQVDPTVVMPWQFEPFHARPEYP
jgi:hypothetical protein